jgi:hypothetical protein
MTGRLIDDMSRPDGLAATGTQWDLVTDGVMGGLSGGTLRRETVEGRRALRMQGDVSLANNGGFIQMAIDLSPGGGPVDAGRSAGIEITVAGNGEGYGMHLRTTAITRPWQSWRQGFVAGAEWSAIRLPFSGFAAHRIDTMFDPTQLRRIALVAIGRSFHADLSLADIRFYG